MNLPNIHFLKTILSSHYFTNTITITEEDGFGYVDRNSIKINRGEDKCTLECEVSWETDKEEQAKGLMVLNLNYFDLKIDDLGDSLELYLKKDDVDQVVINLPYSSSNKIKWLKEEIEKELDQLISEKYKLYLEIEEMFKNNESDTNFIFKNQSLVCLNTLRHLKFELKNSDYDDFILYLNEKYDDAKLDFEKDNVYFGSYIALKDTKFIINRLAEF